LTPIASAENGEVYVAMTGNRCVMKITAGGDSSIAYKIEKPWSPTGVALFGGDVYVLEYDEDTPVLHGDWPPRVKKIAPDGSVTTIAAISRRQ
jgi:hypothetical protein